MEVRGRAGWGGGGGGVWQGCCWRGLLGGGLRGGWSGSGQGGGKAAFSVGRGGANGGCCWDCWWRARTAPGGGLKLGRYRKHCETGLGVHCVPYTGSRWRCKGDTGRLGGRAASEAERCRVCAGSDGHGLPPHARGGRSPGATIRSPHDCTVHGVARNTVYSSLTSCLTHLAQRRDCMYQADSSLLAKEHALAVFLAIKELSAWYIQSRR